MMARKTRDAIYICGGDFERLQARSDCPNTLHDYPLPAGYTEQSEIAMARLNVRWKNPQCPDCQLYGWVPSDDQSDATRPIRVPPIDVQPDP